MKYLDYYPDTTMPSLSQPALITVLGLGLPVRRTPAEPPVYPALNHPAVAGAEVLVGGRAQLALLADHPAEKLPVGRDTAALYAALAANSTAGRRQTVLCSGDPLFYGLGARLRQLLGPERLRCIPGLSSLQGAAACLGFDWEEVRSVSLHGRQSMLPLAAALAFGGPVFLLADASLTPSSLAGWLLERGCAGYRLHMLENLYQTPEGSVRAALHLRLLPEEAAHVPIMREDTAQRVFWLEPLPGGAGSQSHPFGLADADLRAEKGLLTKGPVRAVALAALGIAPGDVVWDLGAGSGSVGLEAARLAWQGRVYSVECRRERLELIRLNRQRHGAANLEIIAGRLPFCLPLYQPEGLSPSARDTGSCASAPRSCVCREEESFPSAQGGALSAGGHPPVNSVSACADGGSQTEAALPFPPRPQRIFLGGGLGGRADLAEETLRRAWAALLPGGRLVVSCVLLSSLERARAVLAACGARLEIHCAQASLGRPLAGDLRLEALNPVFLVLAEKPPPAAPESRATMPDAGAAAGESL